MKDDPDFFVQPSVTEESDAKTRMYAALEGRSDIVSIEVNYDGCGDSGDVEDMFAVNADNESVVITKDLEDLIADYVYEALPDGWEIGDGSFGICTIDVVNKKASFAHSDRFMDIADNSFED